MKSLTYLKDKRTLEQWYLVDHLTLEEIGEKLQISRQGVLYRMRKHCVDMRHGEKFMTVCSGCGVKFEITRARWRESEKHYHDRVCFHQHGNGKRPVDPVAPEDVLRVDSEPSAYEELGFKR